MSDFVIWSGNQLFGPIIGIFIADRLIGGSIEAAGIAVAVFLIVKSMLEIPVGMYIDSSTSEETIYILQFLDRFCLQSRYFYTVLSQLSGNCMCYKYCSARLAQSPTRAGTLSSQSM